MVEFFKVFGGVTASFLGVMLAFLISKILSLEEKADGILDEFEVKINELEELEISISNMGLQNGIFLNAYKNIYNNIMKVEFLSIEEESRLSIIKKEIIENDFFYLDLDETSDKVSDLFLKNKGKVFVNHMVINLDYGLVGELKKTLEIYLFKKNKLDETVKKSRNLKKESSILKNIIIWSIPIFIFGIIYPLSFVKYEDGNLDYSLFNNFVSELFSLSGWLLTIVSIVFFIFCFLLYKGLNKSFNIEKNLKTKLIEYKISKKESYYLKNFLTFKKIEKEIC